MIHRLSKMILCYNPYHLSQNRSSLPFGWKEKWGKGMICPHFLTPILLSNTHFCLFDIKLNHLLQLWIFDDGIKKTNYYLCSSKSQTAFPLLTVIWKRDNQLFDYNERDKQKPRHDDRQSKADSLFLPFFNGGIDGLDGILLQWREGV